MTFSLEFLQSQLPLLWKGLLLTLAISIGAIALSLAGGLVFGAVRARRVPVASVLIECYVELIRNTPFAVQLFFLYFGLPTVGVTLSGPACGLLALSLVGTAYMSENFRAAFEAVPKEPIIAGYSLGLSRRDVFTKIETPIAVRVGVRSVTNTAILVIKDSSILYLISVHELTYTAINIIGVTYRALEMFMFLGAAYLVIVTILALLASSYERKLRISVTV